MELQGTVHTVGQIEEKGQNGFKIAKVILDRKTIYQGKEYPNFTEITFMGNKTALIDERNIAPGDYVKVTGDISGRFYTNQEGKEGHAQDFQVWTLEITRKNIPNNPLTPETNGLA